MEAIPGGSITLRKPVLASASRGFLFILTMLLVSVTALSLSACQSSSSEDSLAAVKKGGKLVIATDDTYPPLEWNEDGEIVGFDIDLMTEICQRIGVKAEFESSKWDGLLTGLAGKQYDAVISTMNITPEREEQADFVEYAGWAQVIVTAPQTPQCLNQMICRESI